MPGHSNGAAPPADLPKYLLISRAVEDRIHRGDWSSGRVPSVRGLAAEHGVSVVTASRALQVLRDKGLITTVDRSGCYLAAARPAAGERWALVQRITPGPFQKEADDVSRRGFKSLAKRQPLDLVHDAFALDGDVGERDLRRQVRRAGAAGVTGVFFMPSRVSDAALRRDELFLAACRAAGLPVVLLERNLRGDWRPLEWDLVANDDVAGGALATSHLLGRGRSRVACVVASPNSSHNGRVAGYLAALHAAARRGAPPAPLVLWEPADLPKKAAYSRLADQLLAAKANGVVCYQDYTAIGLILEFLARGVRVPRDVAVVGFDDLPIGNQFAIGVTTYAFPAEEVARQALRLMRDRIAAPDRPPVQVVVPGRLIVRESSGGPDAGGRMTGPSVADEFIALFAARGTDAYFGEPVSQAEHALQSAHLAERAGAPDELVVAALAHDVGHLLHGLDEAIADRGLDGRHEAAGHAWLLRHFGPAVAEPVRLHVAAKRYCATDPAYLRRLSPASARSLELQGGPFAPDEVAAFEGEPHFAAAVRLRRWDDAAKVQGWAVPPLGHYRPRLDALARPAEGG